MLPLPLLVVVANKQASKQANKPNTSSALRMYFAHGLAGSGSAKGAHTHPLVRADASSTHGFTECSFARRRSSLSSARLEFLAVSAVSSDAMQSIRCDRRTRLHAGGQAGRQRVSVQGKSVRRAGFTSAGKSSLFFLLLRARVIISRHSRFSGGRKGAFFCTDVTAGESLPSSRARDQGTLPAVCQWTRSPRFANPLVRLFFIEMIPFSPLFFA